MTTRRRGARVTVRAHTRQRTVRARAAGSLSVAPPEWFITHPWLREAGVMVTSETASQVAAVYGCCRLITDCLVGADLISTERQSNGNREVLHDDEVVWTLNNGANPRLAPDAPPASAIRSAMLWSTLLLGDGNGYAEIQRDGAGKFYALWPIDPARVTPKRDETGYYYEVRQYSGGVARVHPMDMFHMLGPSLTGWVGDSIVYRGAKVIGMAHAGNVFSAAYYANGTAVSGLLSSDKNVTKEQADRAKAEWLARFGGPDKAGGIAVTGQGLKYQPINHNAQESALVEHKKFLVAEIARFYGVPTALLGENEAWTALSELYRAFYTTLKVWAKRFDEEASRKLYPWRAPWRQVSHDLTYLTLGKFSEQIEALTKATGKPVLTLNEARAMLNKNSVPGGDKLEEPKPEPKPTAAPEDPEEANEEADPEDAPGQRQMAMAVLDRHARRVKARSSDLARKGNTPEQIAGHVAQLRNEARLEMRGVMPGTDSNAVAAALEAVENGVPSDKAFVQIGVAA